MRFLVFPVFLLVHISSAAAAAPTVQINSPTWGPTHFTSGSSILIGGSASDNVAVTQVTWSNDRGGSGAATGTTTWSANIPLQNGANVITVTASDGGGNTATDTLTVTRDATKTPAILYLPFDEGTGMVAYDASGNANHATLVGNPVWVTGKMGAGISFDGLQQHGEIANSPSLNSITNAVSITAWAFRYIDFPGWIHLASREISASWYELWGLGFYDNSYAWQVTTQGSVKSMPFSNGTAPLGQWIHLAGTYDGAVAKLYVNGVLQFSVNHTGPFSAESNPLIISGNTNSGNISGLHETINGRIDELKIFNRALSPAEITAIYENQPPPPADSAPPTISGITVTEITPFSARISWSTGEPSDSQVEFGTTAAYGSATLVQTALVTSHSIVLAPINSNTMFYYRVKSRDSAGNLATSAGSTFATSAPPAPVLHMTMNDGSGTVAADSSGNNNNGALHNGPVWSSGRAGGALLFDGQDDYVSVPSSASLNTIQHAITVSAWVFRYGSQASWSHILSRQIGTTYLELYGMGFVNDRYMWKVTTTGGVQSDYLGTTAPAGVWIHMVGIYDGTAAKLYVNGVENFSTPWTGTFATETNPLLIGANINATEAPGEVPWGKIDDVRIYNWAMTAADVLALYQSAPPFTDVTAPAITQVQASNIGATSAVISWTTNEASDTQVEYGTTAAYGSYTPLVVPPVTSHTITLAGLTPATPYHYRVRSRDQSGNLGTSSDFTFTTSVPVTPDLSLSKSHAGNFRVGSNGTYTIVLRNAPGAGPNTGILTVVDTLPAGLSYVSSAGTGWTCTAVSQTVTCTNPGVLVAGATSNLDITVAVGAAAVPSVTNTVTVSTPLEINLANNQASDRTTVLNAPVFDFDGDGRTDVSVWRRIEGTWSIRRSSDGSTLTRTWGTQNAGDVVVSGDYEGDGKTDIAVWRSGQGIWYVLKSSDAQTLTKAWGTALAGDIPVPADYDGDGKTDIAVYRPATSMWYIVQSSTGNGTVRQFGTINFSEVPVPGDYDGDGRADFAVWRPYEGIWLILKSSDGSTMSRAWGSRNATDTPVPGDYDGDRKTDIAVWRAAAGHWYILKSSDGQTLTRPWGTLLAGDVPVPGDYDGDGKWDIAVWRSSQGTWYIWKSSQASSEIHSWGQQGDLAVPSCYTEIGRQ